MPESADDRLSVRDDESNVERILDECRLVVVSNREPSSHDRAGDDMEVTRPAGGLRAAIDPALRAVGGTWIAWGSGSADDVVDETDCVPVPSEGPHYDLRRVWLNDEELDGRYRNADVAPVTPVRDGLNLVAKQFGRPEHVTRRGVHHR